MPETLMKSSYHYTNTVDIGDENIDDEDEVSVINNPNR